MSLRSNRENILTTIVIFFLFISIIYLVILDRKQKYCLSKYNDGSFEHINLLELKCKNKL